MKHEYYCIEQLDLAGRQFERIDPGYARIALILTDNIIELMLYRSCKKAIIEDDGYFSYGKQFGGPGQFDAKTRRDALGKKFEEKIKFCRRIGVLSAPDSEFIAVAHEYRNDVYHGGILHDDLLYPIAWQYHNFACDLFKRISPLSRVVSSSDTASETVRQHTKQASIGPNHAEQDNAIATAAESLKVLKPILTPGFIEQLSVAAIARIERFGEALYSIADNVGEDESKVLQEIQFLNFIQGEDSPHLEALDKIQNEKEFATFRETVMQTWKPQFTTSPKEGWIKRAEKLKTETDEKLALNKFESVLREVDRLSPMVFEAAYDVEHEIELQSDIARGK